MLEVARQSQHPRAYEVVSTIMKTLMDANKDLIEVSQKKNVKEDKSESPDSGVVNNNLFVGSTAELQKMLKDMRDGSD
jgi:transcriptional accessory protein Tex/SPT6